MQTRRFQKLRRFPVTGSRPSSGGHRWRHTRSALFMGPPSAKPMMRVSDDDGFVRPRTGGSQLWENLVTFENGSVAFGYCRVKVNESNREPRAPEPGT